MACELGAIKIWCRKAFGKVIKKSRSFLKVSALLAWTANDNSAKLESKIAEMVISILLKFETERTRID